MAEMIASSILGEGSTSSEHLDLASLSHSLWQILSSTIRLDGKCLNCHLQFSPHMFYSSCLGFSWATQGQSETEATPVLTWLYASGHCHAERSAVTTVSGLCALVCTLWSRFSSRTSLHLAAFNLP